jgi:quercetin dioxygenase-like cupin family protein
LALRTLVEARFDRPPLDGGTIGLARIALAPGAGVTLVEDPAPVVFLVEAGELRVRGDDSVQVTDLAGSDGGTAVWGERVVRPGDAITVPAGAQLDLRNEADEPAVALGIALTATLARPGGVLAGVHARRPGDPESTLVWPLGVAVEPLVVGSLVSLPTDPITVTVGRAVLAPKAGLPPHPTAGIEVVAVASGRLRLAIDGHGSVVNSARPRVWPPRRDPIVGGAGGPGAEVVLEASEGAVIYEDAVVSLRNPDDAPVEAWVVTLSAAEPGPATPFPLT